MDQAPNLIFTLTARNRLADEVCFFPCNLDRNPDPSAFADADLPSREPTPARSTSASLSQLQFTFDKRPKDPAKGFVFGSDPKICDVKIGMKKNSVSGQHFRITFNAKGDLVLIDTSSSGTMVSYAGQGHFPRRNFMWIIFGDRRDITIEVIDLNIQIQRSTHHEFAAQLQSYLTEVHISLSLDLPAIQSGETTARQSMVHTPTQRPIYLLDERIGKGGFGEVYKAIDVSTGRLYAGKQLLKVLKEWEREVQIMRRLSHVRNLLSNR